MAAQATDVDERHVAGIAAAVQCVPPSVDVNA
jgi:hypothetical protein